MVRTQNMERKYQAGLPVARFPVVATGRAERDQHYLARQQLPPQNEELDWTTLSPSLSGTESPELERAVDPINEEFANPPPQDMDDVFAIVQDLHANPPTSPAAGTVTSKDPDLPTPHSKVGTEAAVPTLLPPTITSETVRPPPALGQKGPCHSGPQERPPPPPHCSSQVPPQRIPATRWGGGLEKVKEAKGPVCIEGDKEIANRDEPHHPLEALYEGHPWTPLWTGAIQDQERCNQGPQDK